MHITHDKGDIAEASVLLDLTKRGFTVFTPTTQNTFADLVFLSESGFKSVQVKYVTPDKGALRIPLCKRMSTMTQCRITYAYKDTSLDYIVAYNPENEQVYYVPRSIWGNNKAEISLRLDPPKNNQIKGIILASDYQDLLL